MKLILTRHGESEENRDGIIQGHIHGKLSKEGVLQADRLALRLKDEHIDAIYSSDLHRASDTANAVKKYHPATPIYLTELLRERDLGRFSGKSKKVLGIDNSNYEAKVDNDPTVESLEDLYLRAERFLKDILHKHLDDVVLVVAHGGINSAIYCVMMKKSAKDIFSNQKRFQNTGISIYDLTRDSQKTILENCIKHLE